MSVLNLFVVVIWSDLVSGSCISECLVCKLDTPCRLRVKADVKADVEPIADVVKIQTKTKAETKAGEPARGARSAPA